MFRSASFCRTTFFWHAPKEGKNAPTQRGSGSVEVLYYTNLLALTTNGVKAQILLNSVFCSQPPLTLPLAVGGFSLHFFDCETILHFKKTLNWFVLFSKVGDTRYPRYAEVVCVSLRSANGGKQTSLRGCRRSRSLRSQDDIERDLLVTFRSRKRNGKRGSQAAEYPPHPLRTK